MTPPSSAVWTKQYLEEVLGASLITGGSKEFSATRVEVGLGRCGPGVLFVATPQKDDQECSPEVIRQALERGAVACVAPQGTARSVDGNAIWEVRDPVDALSRLAHAARNDFSGEVIAVTGSVGKTTTATFINHMLQAVGRSDFVKSGGRNTWRGIISVPRDYDYCVVEAGVGKPGVMEGRAPFIRPHVGVLTNVGISHAENYSHPYEILRNKAVLFDFLEGRQTAIVSRATLDLDDSRERLIRSKNIATLVTVGVDSKDDVRLVRIESDGRSTSGEISVFGRHYPFHCSLPGLHLSQNIMLAAACMSVLGHSVEAGLEALAKVKSVPGRIESRMVYLPGGPVELIDDSKNAAPASLSALLDVVSARYAKRRVLVLGDMRELGADTRQLHERMAPEITQAGIDVLVTVGSLAKRIGDAVPADMAVVSVDEADQAAEVVLSLLSAGDLVAVKGSGAVHMKKVVGAIASSAARRRKKTWGVLDALIVVFALLVGLVAIQSYRNNCIWHGFDQFERWAECLIK